MATKDTVLGAALVTSATDATSAVVIDTLGNGPTCIVELHMNPASATNSSLKWTSLSLQQGTTTDVSNFTAISGAIGTTNSVATATTFVLPTNNNTAATSVVRFHVNLVGKSRYLRVLKQHPAAGATGAVVARFPNEPLAPTTAAQEVTVGAVVHV